MPKRPGVNGVMNIRLCVHVAIAAVVAVEGAACGGSSSPTSPTTAPPAVVADVALTPVASTAEWLAATPAESGIDAARLTDALNRIRRRDYGNITSLLVVRRERLVMEEYFNFVTAANEQLLQSVTKSVMSLAAGLAVDRGLLSVSDPVVSRFPDYQPIAMMDANKQAQTVRDLLMMRTGYNWTEHNYATSPLARMNTCFCDWIRFVLDHPMSEPPGSRFEYVSGGTILLGAVVGRAAGTRVDLFLESELFSQMGFQGARWERGQPQGLPHGGGGLHLRPRDMAKLGALVATGGLWQGRRLMSEAWIRQSTQMLPTNWVFGSYPATYGYLWWGLPGGVIMASGTGGQFIFVVPDRELVVASTAQNNDVQFDAAIRILYDHILPAVQ
jgi:CubicO group peptidase (beta-lactamase class C family)